MEPGLSSARSSRDAVVLINSAVRIVAHSAEIAILAPYLKFSCALAIGLSNFCEKNYEFMGLFSRRMCVTKKFKFH